MQYVLVDIADREKFYPFSLTQSLAQLRIGIFSFQERWERYLNETTSVFTVPYLQKLNSDAPFLHNKDAAIFINVTCLPSQNLVAQILSLKEGEKLVSNSGKWIATHSSERVFEKILLANFTPIDFDQAEFVQDAMDMLQWHTKLI